MPAEPLQKTVKENIASPGRVSFRMRLFQSYILVAFFVFVVFAVSAKLVPYYIWDLPALQFIQSLRSTPLSPILSFMSWPGYYPQVVLFFIAGVSFLWFSGLKWETAVFAASSAVSALAVEILKQVVGRLRPSHVAYVAQVIHSKSFPSGHVVSYTVSLGFLLFLALSLLKKPLYRIIAAAFCLVPIVLIGPSRVFLGEHWPSDTLGAYLFGSGFLFLTILFYRWGKPHYFVKQPVLPSKNFPKSP